MFRFGSAVVLTLFCSSAVSAANPASALAAARQAIESHQYDDATRILQAAIPDAEALADPKEHDDALAALYFYSAVAYSAEGLDDRARDSVRQFLRYHPGSSRIDPEKYAPRFVKMFNEVAAVPDDPSQSFDRYYPGFASVHSAKPKPLALASWGASPEVQLIASPEERTEWGRLHDDDARREFMANFWVSRDPDPSTPRNEWREEFNRRVVFADETFASGSIAGSATDRGRVFVLLGPPARIRITNLMRRRGRSVEVYGAEERWVYFKPQLPATMSQYEVDFRFIVQPEYADSTMENDFLPLHALAEARKVFIAPH